jgi:hypothetical protein
MLPSQSAERVKKRSNQVITPYNASIVVRFQSGGSVLHHVTLTAPEMRCAFAANRNRTMTVRPGPPQLLRSVFAVRQNLTPAGLSELMIDKFGLALL